MPSTETVDIYDLIFERVRNFPHSERIRKKVNFDGLDSSCVEEAKLQIYNRPTTHNITTNQSLASGVAERPKTSIIFSSTFTNSTTMEQTNNMRTEKRTTATCRLQLTKSVTKNGNISIQVTPPNTMIQANGGFSREKTLTTEKEEVLEEELVWSLDSQVRTNSHLILSITFPLTFAIRLATVYLFYFMLAKLSPTRKLSMQGMRQSMLAREDYCNC